LYSIKTHLEKENPDRVEAFKAEAPDAIKKIVANFSNYEVYHYEN